MMINHNLLLEDLIHNQITINYMDGELIAKFSEGDLYEIWSVLQKAETKYPFIWLQSGYKITESSNPGNSSLKLENLKFFIITKGDKNDRYKTRHKTTFELILHPTKKQFIELIKNKKGITLSDDYSFVTFPFNNMVELSARESSYGNKREPQTTTIQDVWDAIYIEIPSIIINKNCFSQYEVN